MQNDSADKKADMGAAPDRGESVALMAPMLLAEGSRHRGALIDLALELAGRASGFRRSLPLGVRTALADLTCIRCWRRSKLGLGWAGSE